MTFISITSGIKLISNESAVALSENKLFLKHFSRILPFFRNTYFEEKCFRWLLYLMPIYLVSHRNTLDKC